MVTREIEGFFDLVNELTGNRDFGLTFAYHGVKQPASGIVGYERFEPARDIGEIVTFWPLDRFPHNRLSFTTAQEALLVRRAPSDTRINYYLAVMPKVAVGILGREIREGRETVLAFVMHNPRLIDRLNQWEMLRANEAQVETFLKCWDDSARIANR